MVGLTGKEQKLKKPDNKLIFLRVMYKSLILFVRSQPKLFVVIGVFIYSVLFSYISLLKYEAFATYGFDLGVYSQALFTASKGLWFYETPDLFWNPEGSFFGVHFSPLLFLLVPFYTMFQDPKALLILQSCVIGLGGLATYLIAESKFGKGGLALCFGLIYLLNPGIHAVNLYDFHLEAFLPTFFLFAYYYFEKHDWIRYAIFFSLISITIEYANLILAFFGLYFLIRSINLPLTLKSMLNMSNRREKNNRNIFIFQKVPFLISLLSVVSSLIMFILSFKLIATFGPSPLTQLRAWPELGSSVDEILFNMLNPIKFLSALRTDWYNKVAYLAFLLFPYAFLPILDPLSLIISMPWLGISLLSQRVMFYQLGWHYSANVVQFLIIGSINGLEKLRKSQSISKLLTINLISAVVLLSIAISPINPIMQKSIHTPAYEQFTKDNHTALLGQVISMVPPNASILTINNIFPYVSNRIEAYLSSVPKPPEYILFDTKSPSIKQRYGEKTSVDLILNAINERNYGIVASADGVILLKADYTDKPLMHVPFQQIFHPSELVLPVDSSIALISNKTSGAKEVLCYLGKNERLPVFWHGPYAVIPFGTYEVTFRLKVEGRISPEDRIITLDCAADRGRIQFSKRSIFGVDLEGKTDWFNVTLKFSLPKLFVDVEFRGLDVKDGIQIRLDYIMVKEIDIHSKNIIDYRYDISNLIPEKGKVQDSFIFHDVGMGSGTLWFGPYERLSPGSYLLTFVLKLDASTTTDILELNVCFNKSRNIVKNVSLSREDFSYGVWKEFYLPFSINQTVVDAEFKGLRVANTTKISLLFVQIETLLDD